ncbi:class I SAM-dependent methyltransferase [Sediminicoccus rosea]|jgi:NADH dehydrogenase [ubiquinone] 1 alpha subcomplex assembly factor 7|uniref:SAM-dependent methyltransferase n=1 Tax=Sediminicoccus rosea TaxID=1225128 RepID=A0ABZ0PBT4_9PROT|nr:SAM-dependent methyltransferase [Sediminicoccus rosea]WPB83026.1 SAM-dependent methyltransferase [Sediminicoccus rosea]
MERLDAFMARAAAAYYAGGEGIGRDFTTAPEMSQAFGECLGLWAAVTWQAMGAPGRVVLAELGPGRGTLMADALRAVDQMVPEFGRALALHLVETSPALRAAQAAKLGPRVAGWHAAVDGLPPGPAIILANEFFDALPIRQFIRRAEGWRERYVLGGAFVEQPCDHMEPAPDGSIREVGEAARDVALALGARLAAQGGALLALDYGPAESGLGDTLQALRDNAACDPLSEPGTADITAHVDFAALAAAGRAAGAAAHGPLPMGVFLQRLGLMARSAMLAQSAPRQAGTILAAAQRLVAPEGMGRLFKALVLAHPALPTPTGFEA